MKKPTAAIRDAIEALEVSHIFHWLSSEYTIFFMPLKLACSCISYEMHFCFHAPFYYLDISSKSIKLEHGLYTTYVGNILGTNCIACVSSPTAFSARNANIWAVTLKATKIHRNFLESQFLFVRMIFMLHRIVLMYYTIMYYFAFLA